MLVKRKPKQKKNLNNRPLTFYHSDNAEEYLTPNLILFERKLKSFDPEPVDVIEDIIFHSKKINNIIGHLCERWQKELHESHKITSPNQNLAIISLNQVVLIEEKGKPSSIWKMGYVIELINGENKEGQGATVGARKSNSLITRPICY